MTARSRPMATTKAWFVAVGIAMFVVTAAVSPAKASADTAYRYWAFYVANGSSWIFSQRGPASEYPSDGEVQGWRFGVQAEAAVDLPPRSTPNFATLCASTPAAPGMLRVGIVVDFGTTADAPPHEIPPATVVPGCVSIKDGGSGADVLDAAARVRLGTGSDGGLVCGIDGYPATECAPVVEAAAPTATPTAHAAESANTAQPAKTAEPSKASPTVLAAAGVASVASPVATAAPASAPARSPGVAASALTVTEPVSPAASGAVVPLATTLATLRSTQHKGHGVPPTTWIGVGLFVILGASAIWRTRRGPR